MSGSGGGVRIPIQAQLDPGDIQAALERLRQQINTVGKAIGDANRVKFNPVDTTSLADLQKVEQGFRRFTQLHGEFRRRLKVTGQQDRGFFDLDWGQIYTNGAARNSASRRAFEYVTQIPFGDALDAGGGAGPGAIPRRPTGVSPGAPRVPRAPAPVHVPRRPPPPLPPSPGMHVAGVLRQGLAGGLGAAGPVGGAINTGISAGAAGGFGAGMAGGLGALLAFGVGSLVSGVREKVGAAQQELIGYDTLKRQLGDVGVSFGQLKESIRNASDAFDVSYEEAQRLGGQFVELANLSREQARSLGGFVAVSGGFSRGFGINPGSANAFFAQQHGLGLTRSVDDTRRLAITIGETIAKSGAFAKAEEVLAVVGAYSAGQTRSGLVAANISAYGGALAGLAGSGIAGMDVQNAANILGRVNSSIANGGQAGEAGQAFLYHAIGRPLGLDPVQAQLLREQGMFGTGAATFGPGSVASNFYGPGANFGSAATSGTTNIEAIMTQMRRVYGNNPSMLAAAISKLTGLNISQSMAFASTPSAQLGGLSAALSRTGVDISSVNASGIANLAAISSGNRGVLMDQSASLRARTGREALSVDERRELDAAEAHARNTGDDSRLRDTLIKLTATRSQEATEGSKTRQSIEDLNKTLQKLAEWLVEPITTMRNMLVAIAGGGKLSQRQVMERQKELEERDVNSQADAEKDAIRQAYAKPFSDAATKAANLRRQRGPWNTAERNAELERQAAEADKEAAGVAAERDAKLGEVDRRRQTNLDDIKKRYAPPPAGSPGQSSDGGGGSGPYTGTTKAQFVEEYGELAMEISRQTGISPDIILAQIANETTYGRKEIPGTNNPFNIQAGAGDDYVSAPDHHADGTTYMAKFKKYRTRAEAAADYVRKLRRQWPGALGAGNDYGKFASGLRIGQQGGYAENPNYGRDLAATGASLPRYTPRTPDGLRNGNLSATGGGTAVGTVTGTFHLVGPDGLPVAPPIDVQTTLSGASPSGTGAH